MSTHALDLNAIRFKPARLTGHVETFFLKASDPSGDRAVWIKATLFAREDVPLRPSAEGWAVIFDRRGGQRRHLAVKHTLPFEAGTFQPDSLGLRWSIPASLGITDGAAELSLFPGESAGLVVSRAHTIRWSLRFSGEAAPLVHLPYPSMYEAPVPTFKLCTPSPDLRVSGEVEVDGERWALEGWPGMQGHTWGRSYPKRYAWAHVNSWDQGDDLVVEGLTASLPLGPLAMPQATLIGVRHLGQAYDFNLPTDLVRASGDIGARRWDFAARNARARIEGSIEASDDDFVGLHHPNPDGRMTYCLSSMLATARVRFEPAGGPAVVRSSRAAALEIGTPDPGHGVRMYL